MAAFVAAIVDASFVLGYDALYEKSSCKTRDRISAVSDEVERHSFALCRDVCGHRHVGGRQPIVHHIGFVSCPKRLH